MKKLMSFVLVITLVITAGFSTAFANSWKHKGGNKLPPGLAKKGFLPPGIAKKFKDIDKYDWAREAIEEMVEEGVIKGIGDGMFAPKRAVTKLEAVVMALRVMGEEEIAMEYGLRIKNGKRKLKMKDRLQEWAYGYVALAEEKGILDEADILYFRLNDPAKRHEVAKYIVRALGYEDEAKDHMDEDLDFKDASFIPQGSVGYIYVADKEGIITGYEDETFRPLNTVTRAEMAVMVDRLDDKYDDIDEDELKEYEGEVQDIDDDYEWIEVEVGSRDKTFDITNDTEVIFEDDVEGDIEDIKVGDEVEIKVNEDDEAVYIEVDRELYQEYKGEVEDIDNDYDWIEIEIDSEDERFEITNDVKVVFEDDVEGDIEDIEVGDEVEVTVNEDDEIEYIEVDRELECDMYEGFLIEIDDEEISILISKEILSFDIDSDIEVEFKDKDGDLDDLMIGDEIKLIMDDEDNDEVERIEVDRKYSAVGITGKLINVYEDKDQIAIEKDDEVTIYDLENRVDVFLNDDEAELSDLEEDDNVLLILDDDEVEEIRAYRLVIID